MAHVTLERNNIVVKCDDGTIIRPGVAADKAQLDKLVGNAIDQAILKADDKHVDEVSQLTSRVAAETAILRGLLTPVQGKEAAPQKRITAPAQAPKESVTPRREVDGKWLEARLDESSGGSLKPIDAIYGNRGELDRQMGVQFPAHQEVATKIVFAALSKIPSFTQYLHAQATASGYPVFSLLSSYVDRYKGLAGAGTDVIGAANVYVRYFLLDLRAQENAAYGLELGQLPKCRSTMDSLQQSLPSVKPLDYPMNSETAIAAALYIRRWNMEQKGMKQEQIPLWQSPETLAAAKQAPVAKAAPLIRIKEPLDTAKFEIKW